MAPMKERTKGLIMATLAPVIWGGALSSGRVVSQYLSPVTTGFIRFSIALILLYPFYRTQIGRLPRLSKREWLLVFLIALFGMVLFNIFLFTSLKTITAIRSSILLAFTPIIVLFLCMLLYRQTVSGGQWTGIALSVTGAVLTITGGDIMSVIENGLAFGDVTMLLAVLSWALYSLVIEQATKTLSSFTILIYAGSIGLVLLFPFTFTEGGWSAVISLPPMAIFNLLYLGIFAAGLSYIWYFEGIKILGSGTASAFLNLEPVAAICIGILFLSEALTAALALGAALVIAGLLLTGKSG